MSHIDDLIARCEESGEADVYELLEEDRVKMLSFILKALRQEIVDEVSRYYLLEGLQTKREWAGRDRGPQIAKTLIHAALRDSDENARSRAVQCLSLYIDQPETLSCLRQVAGNQDEVDFVRVAAVAEICSGHFEAIRRKRRRLANACTRALEKLADVRGIEDSVALNLDIIHNPED